MSKQKNFNDKIGNDLSGKKKVTAIKQKAVIKDLEQPPAAEKESEAPPAAKVGRPAATHDRKRTSVIITPKLWQDFKILSMRHGSNVSDFLEIAIKDALEKYKK